MSSMNFTTYLSSPCLRLIIFLPVLFSCIEKENDGIHLQICYQELEAGTIETDNTVDIKPPTVDITFPKVEVPCLYDSTRDTICFRFSIPHTSIMSMEILNDDGKLVEKLIDSTIYERGDHAVYYRNLKNGRIYSCRTSIDKNVTMYWFFME